MSALIKLLLVLLIAVNLSACGSGSSEKEEPTNPEPELPLESYTPETVPPERKEAFEFMLWHNFTEQVKLISGLYKVDDNGDTTYIFISPLSREGGYGGIYLTAYNYLGDAKDNSGDCFLPPSEGDVNFFLNSGNASDSIGTKIQYKNQFETESKLPEFSIETPAGLLVYTVDHQKLYLSQVSFNSELAVNGKLVNSDANVILSSVKESSFGIEKIIAEQCKGLPAKMAPSGFSGLYDTSVIINQHIVENYLHIDGQGVVTNWKYKGDGFGPTDNLNCYKKSDWYNQRINGHKLMYNKSANYLFTNVLLKEFRWYLDADGAVLAVGAPEPLIQVTDAEIDVSISAKKAALTLDDLIGMECQ